MKNAASSKIVDFKKNINQNNGQNKINIERITEFFCGEYSICEEETLFENYQKDFYELIYVDSGKIEMSFDEKKYILKQSDIVLLFPKQSFFAKSISSVRPSFISIRFLMNFKDAQALRGKLFHADTAISSIYMDIIREYTYADKYSYDMLSSYLKQLILNLCRIEKGRKQPSLFCGFAESPSVYSAEKITNRTVRSIVYYINTNIEKKLSLSDIAKHFNLNPSYTSRLFRMHTDMCITEYIKMRKLSEAKSILKLGIYTITEISEMFSFSSIHYFSNCFKKEFGVSPADYSNMLK